MTSLVFLIPISLAMGVVGVVVFLWTLRSDQYEDMSGDAERILYAEDRPIVPKDQNTARKQKETAR